MAEDTTLSLTARDPEGSRATRRLRRAGNVPGVIYGGDGEPSHFAVDARILRNTLARSGAILEVAVDGGSKAPVQVKDVQRHPVRGDIMHVDFLRVNMSVAITATVVIDLVGAETAPGVVEGGVLNQETREVNIEALPGDIPDSIQHDVSGLEMNATLNLGELTAPQGVTFLDDLEETVVATITPPTAEPVDDEIETETALVGHDDVAEGQAEGDTAEEAAAAAEDSSD
jgi:large subunit ribosomal protein L25